MFESIPAAPVDPIPAILAEQDVAPVVSGDLVVAASAARILDHRPGGEQPFDLWQRALAASPDYLPAAVNLATLAVVLGGNPVEGLPSYLRPVILCAIGMPLLVRFALARVTPDAQRMPRMFLVVDSLFAGGAFVVYVWIMEFMWRRAASEFSELYLTGGALVTLVLAWWYHARALRSFYATADLD